MITISYGQKGGVWGMGVGFTGELKTLVRTGCILLQASNELKEAILASQKPGHGKRE